MFIANLLWDYWHRQSFPFLANGGVIGKPMRAAFEFTITIALRALSLFDLCQNAQFRPLTHIKAAA